MPVVDTLRLKDRLSESGMPGTQAQVLVEELDEVLTVALARETATKADVVELRAAIGGLEERFEQVDKRFEQVDKRFEQVDKRFEQVDKRFEQVDKRLNDLKLDNGILRGDIKLLRWMGGVLVVIQLGIWLRLLFL